MTTTAPAAPGTTTDGAPAGAPTRAAPPPVSFAALLHPVRGRVLLAAGLAALGAAAGLLPFVAVAEIARDLLGPTPVDQGSVWAWATVGALGAVTRVLLAAMAGGVSHFADANFQLHVRRRLAAHLGRVPLGWFTRHGSGTVKRALDDDVSTMHHLIAHAANDVAAGVGVTVAAVTYLLAADWRMALVAIAVVPAGLLAMGAGMRGYREKMAAYTAAQRRVADATVAYADGIAVVKAYGQAGQAHGAFTAAVDAFADHFSTWIRSVQRASALSNVLLSPVPALLVVLAAGTGMVAAGQLDGVDLLPFLLVGLGLSAPYLTLSYGLQAWQDARGAARRVGALLIEPPLPEPAVPAQLPPGPAGSRVEYQNVRFRYEQEGDHHRHLPREGTDGTAAPGTREGTRGDGTDPERPGEALRGVDLVMEPGTVTALVGPSGSGKTTMARLLPRFWDVTGGSVRVGGVDVRDLPSRELLRRIAVVFQDVVLIRDTVRANIALGRPDATDAEIEAAARAAHVHEAITALPAGYDTVLGETGGGLSGGERQRVTIARALLQDAPVLVLDEATAAADPEHEAAVQDALATLAAGSTVLVIAHRLRTVTGADQIVVLDRGQVVERGRHAELLAAGGHYARLWTAQDHHRDTPAPDSGNQPDSGRQVTPAPDDRNQHDGNQEVTR